MLNTHPKIGEPFVIGSQYSMESAVDVVMATSGSGGCGVSGSMDAVRTMAELIQSGVWNKSGNKSGHKSGTRVEQEWNKRKTKIKTKLKSS